MSEANQPSMTAGFREARVGLARPLYLKKSFKYLSKCVYAGREVGADLRHQVQNPCGSTCAELPPPDSVTTLRATFAWCV